MSDAQGLPQLLASLLGVEPQRRAEPPPPVGARPASVVDDPRARIARRPSSGGAERSAGRVPLRPTVSEGPKDDAASVASVEEARRPAEAEPLGSLAPGDDARAGLERVLASRSSLRSAVLAAEVLGRPRALRPYGHDTRL